MKKRVKKREVKWEEEEQGTKKKLEEVKDERKRVFLGGAK